jgi:hypothetical protein
MPLRCIQLLSSHFLQETRTNGIANAGDAVRHAITKTAGTARMADVVRIVAMIFATVESVSTAIADRFDATFAKVMADGGHVSPIANGAMRTRSKDAKTSSVVRLSGLRFRSG